ncbi:MAG: conserved phage C-terminal domain-containing protein [Chlorobium sp.]|nr:conserved phage C-terminal domain-containing protein [Chlorobium sp.]
MAWDWIKVELATPDKAEICGIATELGIDIDAAFGKLFRVWAWFNQYTTNGYAPSVTKLLLDRCVCVPGFCDAMKSVGWMREENAEIILVNFSRHNGETAKTRAMSAIRMSKHRNNNANSDASTVTDVTKKLRKVRHQEQEQEQDKRKDIVGQESRHRNTPPVSEIVSHLNQKAGTEFKATAQATKQHIKARLAEGFSLSEFFEVIDAKTDEWRTDAKMSQYLRPQTLFGTKFESYLQAARAAPKKDLPPGHDWEPLVDLEALAAEKQKLKEARCIQTRH